MNSDGKMHPTSGNSILIGAFAAFSSARWRRSIRSCSDWTCSTLEIETPSCSAWMTAPMKLRERRDLGARDDVPQGLAPRLADADLGQRPPELLGERSLELLDHLAQRAVEAEARTDGDRQQVQRVGDLEQDLVLALPDAAAQPELRGHVPDRTADHDHHDVERDTERDQAREHEQQDDEADADDDAHGLDAQPVRDPELAGVAGQRQPLLGRLGERGAREPRDGARQAGDQRPDRPLEQRLLELELLEVLRLHRAELGEAGLDRVDRRPPGEADEDQEDRAGRDGPRRPRAECSSMA